MGLTESSQKNSLWKSKSQAYGAYERPRQALTLPNKPTKADRTISNPLPHVKYDPFVDYEMLLDRGCILDHTPKLTKRRSDPLLDYANDDETFMENDYNSNDFPDEPPLFKSSISFPLASPVCEKETQTSPACTLTKSKTCIDLNRNEKIRRGRQKKRGRLSKVSSSVPAKMSQVQGEPYVSFHYEEASLYIPKRQKSQIFIKCNPRLDNSDCVNGNWESVKLSPNVWFEPNVPSNCDIRCSPERDVAMNDSDIFSDNFQQSEDFEPDYSCDTFSGDFDTVKKCPDDSFDTIKKSPVVIFNEEVPQIPHVVTELRLPLPHWQPRLVDILKKSESASQLNQSLPNSFSKLAKKVTRGASFNEALRGKDFFPQPLLDTEGSNLNDAYGRNDLKGNTDCGFMCHEQCQSVVSLDCTTSQSSESNSLIEESLPEDPSDIFDEVNIKVEEVETSESSYNENNEDSTLRRTVYRIQSHLVAGSEIEEWVQKCSTENQGLQISKENDGSYRGCLRIHLNLSRPINIVAGTRPPSIYDILQEDRTIEKTLTSFYMPRDAVKAIHINSCTTTREVIVALLKKFKVVDNPQKFALYEKSYEVRQSMKAKLRRLEDNECPLALAIAWSVQSLTNKRLVLQENDTADIQWDAFSLPELTNFLRILDKEEEEYKSQIIDKYNRLRSRIDDELSSRKS